MRKVALRLLATITFVTASCTTAGTWRSGPLPPPATASGPLEIKVVYPRTSDTVETVGDTTLLTAREDQVITSRDSAFILGSVGRGDAELTVNGTQVDVYPTGGWIAWLPLSGDSIQVFEISATAGGVKQFARLTVRVAPYFREPDSAVWIDTTSLSPVGDAWVRPDERVALTVTAAAGAEVYLRLRDSQLVRILPVGGADERSWGEIAFATNPNASAPRAAGRRYEVWLRGPLGPDPGPILKPAPEPPDTALTWPTVLAVVGRDTAVARWPLRLGVIDTSQTTVAVVNDDPECLGDTDRLTPGRPSPWGTYHWFFPNSTVAEVSGRVGGQVRLQLSQGAVAWVNAVDVQPLTPGTPPPRGTTRSIRLVPGGESLTLRMPLPGRIPYRIDESEYEVTVTLYGVAADIDWIQYGGTDPLISLISFSQPTADETVVNVRLTQRVWGYRARWVGNDLMLEIRRPPAVDRRNPLRGRLIALDPGHPPGGAIGPTGSTEWDIVLAVADKAKVLLEDHGARVVLTRTSNSVMGLLERTVTAEDSGAEVLVSIHANALPDGVNPYSNNGTSVYYYQPRSASLARELNRALVEQFGSRDLGMGRGDLALVRATWMPSALTEGLFIILPDQEAILASEVGQWRYAQGIVEGIRRFLAQSAN